MTSTMALIQASPSSALTPIMTIAATTTILRDGSAATASRLHDTTATTMPSSRTAKKSGKKSSLLPG